MSALTSNVRGADGFIPLPRSLTEFKRVYGESLHRVEADGKAFPERTEVYSLRHMNCDITMCFWKPADLNTDLYVHYLRVKSVSGEAFSDAQMKHFEVPVAGDAAWRVDTERRGGRTVFLAQKGFKVSNVPLVLGIEPPLELFKMDQERIFGLTIQEESLLQIRQARI